MEKFGNFKFKLFKANNGCGWFYEIYDAKCIPIKLSQESFQFEGIARFAVIGHITLLEQKKGKGHSLKCPDKFYDSI